MSNPPPFRADHIGALLLPESGPLQDLPPEADPEERDLAAQEVLRQIIGMQQDAGLQGITDGALWQGPGQCSFAMGLTGIDLQAKGTAQRLAVQERLGWAADHPMLARFGWLASGTENTAKACLPAPSTLHARMAAEDVQVQAYRDDPQVLFDDLVQTYRSAIAAFQAAGCRYLQLEERGFSALRDPAQCGLWQDQGLDPDWLMERYGWMIGAAIQGRAEDMVIGLHLDPPVMEDPAREERIAEAVFATGVDVVLMGLDMEHPDGLLPLDLLPKGRQRVMLGQIRARDTALEPLDGLRRQIDTAARHADLDQLGIAPDHGFAAEGDGPLTYDDMRRKLDLVVATAEAVWGSP